MSQSGKVNDHGSINTHGVYSHTHTRTLHPRFSAHHSNKRPLYLQGNRLDHVQDAKWPQAEERREKELELSSRAPTWLAARQAKALRCQFVLLMLINGSFVCSGSPINKAREPDVAPRVAPLPSPPRFWSHLKRRRPTRPLVVVSSGKSSRGGLPP